MNKVLAIAPYSYLPYFSGGQKFIARFFEWLSKEKDLTVISVAENDTSQARGYKVLPLLKKGFSRYYDRSLTSKLLALIKKEGFDTIIWEHPYYAWLAMKIKRKTGIETILHTHNIEFKRFRSTGRWWWPLLRNYEKNFFRKADKVLFISPDDKLFAIDHWKLPGEKCIDLPFGIDISRYPEDRSMAREKIAARFGILPNEKILFFNGLLNYRPNLDALRFILDNINPLLLASPGFSYKILICGKGLPEDLQLLEAYKQQNVMYGGYTDDIASFYKASDVLLNPVQSGGGVKTKIVEAIGYGCTVVSTKTGSMGINTISCGDKLSIVPDDNWEVFSEKILRQSQLNSLTPASFYEYYYWGNVIKRLLPALSYHPSR